MREIVNVQLGTYSNHIGAHFWNLHDEYLATPPASRELSPSVLFRESSGAPSSRVPLYAPRLQAVDLSGAFGSISLDAGAVLPDSAVDETGAQPGAEQLAWGGRADTFRRERVPPSGYVGSLLAEEAAADAEAAESKAEAVNAKRVNPKEAERVQEPPPTTDFNLDAGVAYWADFLKTRLHPRTCFSLPGMHAGVSPFEKFDHGADIASTRLTDALFDELRYFVEECDALGGVHIVTHADDGFAGLAAVYLERLRDELGGGCPIFVVGADAPRNLDEKTPLERALAVRDRCTAEARLVSQCVGLSAQYVPVNVGATGGLAHVRPKQGNDYHSSAIVALALDVAYTPLRFQAASLSSGGLMNSLRPAPLAAVSSLFANFPVVQNGVPETGFFYNRPSSAKLSLRSFPKLRTAAAPSGLPSTNVCEVVSSRGVPKQPGVVASVASQVALPVAYPRFFDATVATDGEMEEVKCVSGFATSGAEGAAFLRRHAALLGEATKKTSSRHTSEAATLVEIGEVLSGLAQDYATL